MGLTPLLSGAAASAVGNVAGQTVGIATGLQCDFSGDELAFSALLGGLTGGIALRPYTAPNQPVTSWAPPGVEPTIESGRWVMTGGPTLRNWIESGIFRSYPLSNSTSTTLSGTALRWPSGWESIKGLIGQRVVK